MSQNIRGSQNDSQQAEEKMIIASLKKLPNTSAETAEQIAPIQKRLGNMSYSFVLSYGGWQICQ